MRKETVKRILKVVELITLFSVWLDYLLKVNKSYNVKSFIILMLLFVIITLKVKKI